MFPDTSNPKRRPPMHPQSTSDVHRELQRHGNLKPGAKKREFRPPTSTQRVAIAIDVQNLYYGAKDFSGSRSAKVAYEKFIERALGGRPLVRAVAYIADKEGNNQEKFIGIMRRLGCDIRQKQVAEYEGGHSKCNWDVEIAVDAMAIASKVDVFILASGDGDFSYLLHAMKILGVRTEVMSFRINTSGALMAEADRYYDMRQDMLLMDRRSRPDNGNGGIPQENKPPKRRDEGNKKPEPEPESDDFYEPPSYDDE
jgi:uncharacterized LabA/DUF88 family protein